MRPRIVTITLGALFLALLSARLPSQFSTSMKSPLSGGKIEFRTGGYFPPGFPLHGSVKLLTSPIVEMGSRNRHRVEVRIGDIPIETGMSMEVWKHFTSDVEEFQSTDSNAPAYFSAALPAAVEARAVTFTNWEQRNVPPVFPYRRTAGITISQGRLKTGDTVSFDLGGPQGVRMQFYEENLFNFRFVIVKDGVVQSYLGDAAVKVTGGPLDKLRVQAPAVVKTGETFPVEIVPMDAWVSQAKNSKGLSLRLTASNIEGGVVRYDESLEHYIARDVKATRAGTVRIEAATADGKFRGISNPVWVEDDPLRGAYFGEMHQHSYVHDGRGMFEELYLYGRRVGLLDFGAVTPHHTFLTGQGPLYYLPKRYPVDEWPKLQDSTKLINGWQGFVSLLGYEYSVATASGGHHNIFYNADRAKTTMQLDPAQPAAPIAKMLETVKLARVPTLVIPHIGGGPPDWSHATDPRIERLFEIASVHGVFEESWQKHLENGLRLGAIAAGDTHTTSMGIAYPGLIYVHPNGLAGVWSSGKTRQQIWDALFEKRTFAATGNQRMLLDFRVNSEPMGGEISSTLHKEARIEARVSGTAPLLRVELIKNNRVIESQAPARDRGQLLRIVWGDNIYQRRAAVGLRAGSLTAAQGRLKLVSTVNLDQAFEELGQRGDAIAWRTAAVSNDRDGALIDLTEVRGSSLRFRLDDADTVGVIETDIPLPALRADGVYRYRQSAKFDHPYMKQMGVEPAFFIECELVDPQRPMDARFQFVDRAQPKPGDFYYLRVEQLDTNKAWSSPVWVN